MRDFLKRPHCRQGPASPLPHSRMA